MASLKVRSIEAGAYTVPTATPESDGTLEWDKTTLVVVEASGGDFTGLGYTYADSGTAALIREILAPVVIGADALSPEGAWWSMLRRTRNLGRPGLVSMAISAVDIALWDLKAKALSISFVDLLGRVRETAPAYGSGGFTSYSIEELQAQLGDWVEAGLKRVKMKVGHDPENDLKRVKAARRAIGEDAELFVDANGAYARKQALRFSEAFAEFGVSWFEEPVSSDDLEGLRLLRDRAPAGIDIAAGEYGYDMFYFKRMIDSGAVDVLQADATRCGGVTGFLKAAALCEAFGIPLSAHTAPTLHGHLACVSRPIRHVEFFFDHARIEAKFFEGALIPVRGHLRPDRSAAGLGLAFKKSEALRYAV